MLEPSSFLTPHKVTLALLVRLCVEEAGGDDDDEGDGDDSVRLELSLYLVEEVRSSAQFFEKSLDDVLEDVEALGSGGIHVTQRLMDALNDMNSPDALFSFLESDLKAVAAGEESRIERNSVFDVFIRKVLLSFHTIPFERFSALYTDLVAYRDVTTSGMDRDDERRAPPPLSADDLNAHVHREARLLEESTEPLDLDALEVDIEAMMRLAEKVPKVLYLRFLRAMHSRDFAQALDDLHRYFDMFATGGINVQYAVLNLAALHLHFGHLEEAMHAINETVRVAQQSDDATALAFAVAWLLRVVQAQNGTRTTRRPPSHDAKEEERMLRRCFSCASEEELPHLACITALACGRHVLTVGAPPDSNSGAALAGLEEGPDQRMAPLPAAAWACQAAARHHARLALSSAQTQPASDGDFSGAGLATAGSRHGASAHGFSATVWNHLGHSTLAHALASLQLSHFSDDGLRQDTVTAACLLATQAAARADYSQCYATLRAAFDVLPAPGAPQSPLYRRPPYSCLTVGLCAEALVPRTALSVMHSRAVARSDAAAATAAVGELLALASSSVNAPHYAEALACQAQVTLTKRQFQLAFRQATELCHLHRCRGQTAELGNLQPCPSLTALADTDTFGLVAVPVLLLLGELHQHADSPVAALPHALSCLSLCDALSMVRTRAPGTFRNASRSQV